MKRGDSAKGIIAHCTGLEFREMDGAGELELRSRGVTEHWALERREMCKLYMALHDALTHQGGCAKVLPFARVDAH